MPQTSYVRAERILLKTHPQLNEKWVQSKIAEDPSVLGLGDLVLKDQERMQPRSGRLDLLMQDADTARRYEVEIQLGPTDESHIIRTIEYWDIEKKRYPQYDHCAVLIAEDITSRFLNVIGLFNGHIPLVALQMSAVRVGEYTTLLFTKVLDELILGLVEEDEEVREVTDRNYWDKRGTQATVALADDMLGLIRTFEPDLALKYNKFYIGLAKEGQASNFVIFRPQKNRLLVEPRLGRSKEIDEQLEQAGLAADYDSRRGRYRLSLVKGDAKKHEPLLNELFRWAHANSAEVSS